MRASIYVQGEVVSLRQQISNFEAVTLPDLRAQLRGAAATSRVKGQQDPFQRGYLSKCLFVIGTGGNDYLLNYFSPRKNGTPLPEFTRSLITKLSDHLQVPNTPLACSCSISPLMVVHVHARSSP